MRICKQFSGGKNELSNKFNNRYKVKVFSLRSANFKRYTLITLVVLISLCLTVNSNFANTNTYTLDDLDMTISVPSDMITFTRDLEENDSNLKELEIINSELQMRLIDEHIYLEAISSDFQYRIFITMLDYSGSQGIFNFNLFSDEDLAKGLAEEMLSSEVAKKKGIYYKDYSIYEDGLVKYIVYNMGHSDESDIVYGIEYSTIYNGKAINITLQSYEEEVTPSLAYILENVVDGIVFTKTLEAPNSIESETDAVINPLKMLRDGSIGLISGGVLVGILAGLYALSDFVKKKKKRKNGLVNKKSCNEKCTTGDKGQEGQDYEKEPIKSLVGGTNNHDNISLVIDNKEVECKLLGVFDCGGKDYIAIIPMSETYYIWFYRYEDTHDGEFDVINIDDDSEFQRVVNEFGKYEIASELRNDGIIHNFDKITRETQDKEQLLFIKVDIYR